MQFRLLSRTADGFKAGFYNTTNQPGVSTIVQETFGKKGFANWVGESKRNEIYARTPNGEKITAKRVDRNFLFSIMNNIDPEFFPKPVNKVV